MPEAEAPSAFAFCGTISIQNNEKKKTGAFLSEKDIFQRKYSKKPEQIIVNHFEKPTFGRFPFVQKDERF